MCSLFLRLSQGWSGDLREHVGLAKDEQVLAVHRNLRAAVLRVEDLVALGHVERCPLAGFLAHLPVTDRQHLAALRLLLGGVGEDDAARGGLLLLHRLDDQALAEWLELHSQNLRLESWLRVRFGTLPPRVPSANAPRVLRRGARRAPPP